MLITRLICMQCTFTTPDQFIASPSKFSLKYSLVPERNQRFQAIEFVDRPVPEKLDIFRVNLS